jgi:prolyl-tRNA editing enzyme YbaK/EbsC (Cys-tRNA(Pro) deacylase)
VTVRGPLDLTRELLSAEVLHEIVHLRRRIDDAVELPDVLGVPVSSCLAVRLYDASGLVLAAFLPPGAVAATTALARACGAPVVQALPPGRVSAVTDCHPSLVPPVGLPASVAVVADAFLGDQEVVFTPTGDGSTALKIRAADLLALTGATIAPLVEPGTYDVAHGAGGGWRADPYAHLARR